MSRWSTPVDVVVGVVDADVEAAAAQAVGREEFVWQISELPLLLLLLLQELLQEDEVNVAPAVYL